MKFIMKSNKAGNCDAEWLFEGRIQVFWPLDPPKEQSEAGLMSAATEGIMICLSVESSLPPADA